MKISIYCLFNDLNIPIYVGKTKNSLKTRENQHRIRLKQNVRIYELELVEYNEGSFWEMYWIEQMKYWDFDLINKNKGGGGPKSHTEESLNKMRGHSHPGTSKKLKGIKRPDVSLNLKGSKKSEETKRKMSEGKKGHECYSNPNRTKKIKKSNIKHYKKGSNRNKKISKKLKGKKKNRKIFLIRPVLQFDLNWNFIKEFESPRVAGIELGLEKTGAIGECCLGQGGRKTAYGYKWKYKDYNIKRK